jgi:hypothetical protein
MLSIHSHIPPDSLNEKMVIVLPATVLQENIKKEIKEGITQRATNA